jgi:hypothetical protein
MGFAEIEKMERWADANPFDVPLDKIDMSRLSSPRPVFTTNGLPD